MSISAYGIVGLGATASHYALLLVLVEGAAVPPGLASAAGAILGGIVAYFGNRRFTFGAQGTPHRHAAPRFALTALGGAAVNGGIVGLGHAAGMPYLALQVLATAVVMLLTYEVNRRWAFRPPHASDPVKADIQSP